MPLFWIIAAPLLAVFAAPHLARVAGARAAGVALSAIPFSIAGWLLADAMAGTPAREVAYDWIPSLGIQLALLVGGFERLFLLLVSFIGGLVLIYGGAYLAGDSKAPRFFSIVLFFMASMLGVIAADDLILTFVFWELTSITSFLLVGYKFQDAGARKAALQALLVTGAGGLALLAGLILLTQITGETRISALAAHSETIANSPLFVPALLLVLVGVFTKSAQVPFHFWLPGAMAAPTPVSAYLHSATMVKAGVILLAKLSPAMSHTALWGWIVAPVGALTMITGAVMAIHQTDLKRLLAYSTVSVLGTLVMLLGFGDAFSFKTAMFLALVHGFYKGSLFMVAGTVDLSTGTRDVRSLSGLRHRMPWLALAAGAAALSMSGVPPTLGFISKELMYEAKLSLPIARHAVTALGVLSNSLAVAIALIVGVMPFVGARGPATVRHRPGWGLVAPPALLALLGLALGLFPGWLDANLISPAASSLGIDPKQAKLTLWHGFTPVLWLSMATLCAGWLFYKIHPRFGRIARAMGKFQFITPTALYFSGLDGLMKCAGFLTGWIQGGQLRIYVRVTLCAASFIILYALSEALADFSTSSKVPVRFFQTMVVILMSVSAIAAVLAKNRLAAILSLGGVGYSVALVFAFYGAPDLAITQVLVETLTVVLFSFVILKLPQIRDISRVRTRRWDAVVATLTGLAMTAVVWKSVHVQMSEPISPGLVARSVTEAHGRNVVNVILVDFRALDTMGEILVLALGCMGVTALLYRKRRHRVPHDTPGEHEAATMGQTPATSDPAP
ncbi:MAG TPA: hydrogen gas-evolving membrane-bound hydrogenase subunit E [Luteolibacter sp.]|nr:hydrogen gas-evolving membrane-bound hydrogenase subunit E [Luteolibacter sp.]